MRTLLENIGGYQHIHTCNTYNCCVYPLLHTVHLKRVSVAVSKEERLSHIYTTTIVVIIAHCLKYFMSMQ